MLSVNIIENLEDLLKNKTEDMLIHVGTNNITNGLNLLNSVNKISNISPRTTVVFSSIIVRKDKKNVEKSLMDTNNRPKNYCRQKEISYVENSNIEESHLGEKKFHLDKTGKKFFAKYLINYIKNLDKCISNTLKYTEPNARYQPSQGQYE